jgi:hypothetical protein
LNLMPKLESLKWVCFEKTDKEIESFG